MNLLHRRHYRVILWLVIVIAATVFFLGDQRVIAYTTRLDSTSEGDGKIEGIDVHNDVALFDDTLVHEIQVVMAQEEYDEMISTYQKTGEKEYFHADVIIDGVRVEDVGIRLKGNASLMTALGGRMGGMGGERGDQQPGFQGGRQMPEQPPDGELPEGFQPPADGELPEMPAGGQPPAGGGMGFPGGMPGSGEVSSEDVKIPFLIKFDEYVDGQTYQGYQRVAIRTYGITPDEAILEEPLTNELVQLAGLPATQTAYAGFLINDNVPRLYVISEIIDEDYLAKYFDNADGILYKAEVGSTLSYQGDDPSAYAQDFSQETRQNEADLAALIAFMRFIDQADEATFEAELPDYLDVESFATYLAVNDLLVNTDSLIGMSNNFYLYYDDQAQRFTLLMWDANESFGGLGGGRAADYDLYFASGSQGFGGMRGPGGGENVLLERFMAVDSFKALYEEKLVEVYEKAFLSGAILEDIQRYSDLIHSVNAERSLVDIEAYDQSVQTIVDFVEARAAYLESTQLLGNSSDE
jgi:spore coat protein CotH